MKTISFFSGAGGLDYGFDKNGFKILFSNDMNKIACQSYALNYNHPIICDSFYNVIKSNIETVDVIIGGPPCQGFSVQGKMDINDKRNNLILDYFNFILTKQPKIFVCENVKALMTLKKWEPIKNKILDIVKNDYHIFMEIINASHYDVCQRRERVFIIGFSKKYFSENVINIFRELLYSNKKESINAKEFLKKIGPISESNPSTCNSKIVPYKKPIIRNNYGGFLFNGQGRIVNPYRPVQTIIASLGGGHTPIIDEREMYGDGHSFFDEYVNHLKNGGNVYTQEQMPTTLRRLTITEAKAIQSFPSDYQLTGSKTAIYRQIGNAVPCKVSYVLANCLKKIMDTV